MADKDEHNNDIQLEDDEFEEFPAVKTEDCECLPWALTWIDEDLETDEWMNEKCIRKCFDDKVLKVSTDLVDTDVEMIDISSDKIKK